MKITRLFSISTLVFLACGVDEAATLQGEEAGAVEEAALKSYPGLNEGSEDALGVLKLANEGSLELLSSSKEVNLPSRTAKSIIAARPLPTLAKLFAVRYVGEVSVTNLLTYARAHGYVAKRFTISVPAKDGEDWPNHPAPRTTYTFGARVLGANITLTGSTTQGSYGETLTLKPQGAGTSHFSRGTSNDYPVRLQISGDVNSEGKVTSFSLLDARYAQGSQGYDYFWMNTGAITVTPVP